jgi:hypothetical protein
VGFRDVGRNYRLLGGLVPADSAGIGDASGGTPPVAAEPGGAVSLAAVTVGAAPPDTAPAAGGDTPGGVVLPAGKAGVVAPGVAPAGE